MQTDMRPMGAWTRYLTLTATTTFFERIWSLDKDAIGCQSLLSYVRGCLLEELVLIPESWSLGLLGHKWDGLKGRWTSPTSFILTYKALYYSYTNGCLSGKWLNQYKAGISEPPRFSLWNVKSCAFNSALGRCFSVSTTVVWPLVGLV